MRKFKNYIQKSHWKIDFKPIFSPIFQNFCNFMHLWNIKVFGVGLGGGSSAGIWGVFLMTLDFLRVGGGINPCWRDRCENIYSNIIEVIYAAEGKWHFWVRFTGVEFNFYLQRPKFGVKFQKFAFTLFKSWNNYWETQENASKLFGKIFIVSSIGNNKPKFFYSFLIDTITLKKFVKF